MSSRRNNASGLAWPDDWMVAFQWEFNGVTMTTREHEFRVSESRRGAQWFLFDRHVRSKTTGTEWFDGFDASGGFVAYRPEQITEVRAKRGRKPGTAAIKGASPDLVVYDELGPDDGDQAAELAEAKPARKPRTPKIIPVKPRTVKAKRK